MYRKQHTPVQWKEALNGCALLSSGCAPTLAGAMTNTTGETVMFTASRIAYLIVQDCAAVITPRRIAIREARYGIAAIRVYQ